MTEGQAVEKPKKRNVLLWVVLGCGGALALVAVLAVIAAIAIPAFFTRHQGLRDPDAVVSMREYAEAQVMFHRNDWDGDGQLEYADKLPMLVNTKGPGGSPLELLDQAFAAAHGANGAPKHGYIFREMKTIGGVKINWVDDYALCAIPAQYGRTGYRTLIINTNGVVYVKDQGPGGTFVDDYPQNPAATGWMINE